MLDETWRSIAGYEGLYDVSSFGRIRRCGGGRGAVAGRVLTTKRTRKGYRHVDLSRDDVKTRRLVHQLVAAAFLPERPSPAHHPNHIDADKANNRADNLEWLTIPENNAHARTLGLIPPLRGIRNGRAKLTPENVAAIRCSADSDRVLGERFGVSKAAIWAVRNGRNWKAA